MAVTTPEVGGPVSATMLARMKEHDAGLERCSVPLIACVEHEVDVHGCVEVLHGTAGFYRYFDATPMVEALYGWA
ncbi:MAG: hypothetical protein EXR69_15350 [Myxococcales bacterium]|nr:hypothetical protein [Myxococcales bacterium]